MLFQFIFGFKAAAAFMAHKSNRRVIEFHVLATRFVFGKLLLAMWTRVHSINGMGFSMFHKLRCALVPLRTEWALDKAIFRIERMDFHVHRQRRRCLKMLQANMALHQRFFIITFGRMMFLKCSNS